MKAPARLPEDQALVTGLTEVLGVDGSPGVRILDRSPAIWSSTYPSEVVTCQVGRDDQLKLYCKYMAGLRYESFGHRGGVPYEVEVYRHVLAGLLLPVPRFYGAYRPPATDDVWLMLQYLDQGSRVTKGPQPESVLQAARWVGSFHAANEARISRPELSFLKTYDAEYYLGWVRRTLRFAGEVRPNLGWLGSLCKRFEECIGILLSPPLTIIHGEFYPHNILISGGRVYPIDWESAAIASGEVDLAALTEAWEPSDVRQCQLAYRQARWGEATPRDFERRLDAARLYLCFRWTGEQPEWTLSEGNRSYFEEMRVLAERLDLI